MYLLKIGNNYEIPISEFNETKDFYERPGMHFLRIDFYELSPYGPNTIDELASMFKDIPFLIVIETDTGKRLQIEGPIALFRISRDARGGKFILSVHLTKL